jgi:hypothetical protein
LLVNADLLGSLPSPRAMLEKLFENPAAFKTVADPDSVAAVLLSPRSDSGLKKITAGPITLPRDLAQKISSLLTDFDSYSFGGQKGCIVDYGARLEFKRDDDRVQISFCWECQNLEIQYGASSEFLDFNRNILSLREPLEAAFLSCA